MGGQGTNTSSIALLNFSSLTISFYNVISNISLEDSGGLPEAAEKLLK